jgi:hypothetical protein
MMTHFTTQVDFPKSEHPPKGLTIFRWQAVEGLTEGVRNCGDRATAPIEDIWREEIRGCSYGGACSMSAMPR